MTVLAAEDVRLFAERGYLVLPGLVPPDRVGVAGAEVDRIVAADPPPAGHTGHHFYWREAAGSPALFDLLAGPGGILEAAADLAGAPGVELAFGQAQVALNIPPHRHRPGRPHLDGYRDGQEVPGTFTLLAGLLLTDQEGDDGGNLWVWPGTHLTHARFFAARGPDAFAEAGGYPDVTLPEPVQVHGRAGDVLLAHYLLGHNIGGNYRSDTVRRALYWRLRKPGHEGRWARCLADPWCEYDGVRRVVEAGEVLRS